MTWEWVVLILGIVALLALLLGYITWTQMRVQMFQAIPRTLPDMFKATSKLEEKAPRLEAEDTLVEAQWPEGFTGREE
jgi:hypothetical protein